MKIVFVSNYYNHHQKPLADALYSIIGENYHFIETSVITKERLAMGWGGDERPAYVLQNYIDAESKTKCQKIIDEADIVIYGSAPYDLIESRLKNGKIVFKYCERPYKNGVSILKIPLHIIRSHRKYVRYKNFYVLCASAYTPFDFSKVLAFKGKTYKWGYFTELKRYEDIDDIIERKDASSILWVSRFIPLKHPEFPLELAERLKKEGHNFKIKMIGNGLMEAQIEEMIIKKSLSDNVELLGSMNPQQVREHMEKSEMFIFTSDRNEGWGAVLNESMNSACAVVANSAIGSVPFLINDGENGSMYKDGDFNDFYNKVKKLLVDSNERKRIARNAYRTMTEEWNAQNAAEKFVALCERLLAGEYKPFPFERGVCSKAIILKDDWYNNT